MDLIIRNAKLRNRENMVDIAINQGRFVLLEERIEQQALREIDAQGRLVTAPFVESHVHLDSALSAGVPRDNLSGTLLEAIEIWGERKQTLTKAIIKEHAMEAIKWQIANGVLHIRTHADSTEPSLRTMEAMLELKDELKDLVDIQVVAFPQDGIFTHRGLDELMVEALNMGADVVGGMPQLELTREDGVQSIAYIFELAERFNKPIDIHTDETGDEQSRYAEVIAKYAIQTGMEGLVTASHATAMHNYNNDYAAKLIGMLKRADVNIVTNPFSNTLLQNRLDGYPRKRGYARVDELLARGVNVSIGNDNMMDPFGPLGKGNMLQAAHLLAHTAHLSGKAQMLDLFNMISVHGAKTLNLAKYGIELGNQADCIILDAKDEQEAIRLTSECLYVIRKGNIVVETKPAKRKLTWEHSTFEIDFKVE